MPKTAARTAAPEKQKTEAAPALPMRYDVRINSLQMNGNTKGTATVNLNGQFAFRNISIMQGKESLFASPPGYKVSENNYKSHFFPCTKESHAEFESAVLEAYRQARDHGTSGQNQGTAEILPLQYDVRINSLHPGGGALKGTASVNLNGQFAIPRVSIMESSKGLFVSMPGFRGRNGQFKDYCFPCTKESHAEFESAVLGAYEQALTQSQESGQQMGAPDPFAGQAPNSAPEMRM